MNIKKSLKDVIVLVAICVVFGTILAVVNSITAPIIAERLEGAANQAYEAVMPGAAGFEDVDLTAYELPATVKEAKRETSGKGFAIKLEIKGYDNGMIIIVGVSSEGVVTGATCIESKETNGVEKSYGDKFLNKDLDGAKAVDTVAGSTLTSTAYRTVVVDAINASTILGGGSADLRTEEEILRDNLMAALPDGGESFTKMFMVEVVEGVDKIYVADNGAGYVCVIGEEFIGVTADGTALGESENKAVAEAAIAIVSATGDLTAIDITTLEGISKLVTSVEKTNSGNYVVKLNAEGYGIKGDHYIASGKYIEMIVSISKDGKIIDSQTLSQEETPGYGDLKLKDGAYNMEFIGKTEAEAGEVDVKNGATFTSDGYKKAILNAFKVYTIIEGGAANE